VMAGSLQTLIVYVAFGSECNPDRCGFERLHSPTVPTGSGE